MIVPLARLMERYLNLPSIHTIPILTRLAVTLAALIFLTAATLIIALEAVFPVQSGGAQLEIGDVVQRDLHAPETRTYESQILTAQRRTEAERNVRPIYNPPDPNVARAQSRLATQIVDFITNIRRDPYATNAQQRDDLRQITALTLNDNIIDQILEMSDDDWTAVSNEVTRLLEQVMQESIREIDLTTTLERLPVQVSLRFNDVQRAVIVAIVEDLVRPNMTENIEQTEQARAAAADAIPVERRSLQRGQIIVREGAQIQPLDYEALQMLGLLQPAEQRFQQITQAMTVGITVMVIIGLYLLRFHPSLLYSEPRLLGLLALIFLATLFGARLALNSEFYLFPSALLALLYVTLINAQVAICGTLGLAILIGVMANNSLELTVLVLASGLIGALTLRRPERLNSYFVTGIIISVMNMTVATIFNLTALPEVGNAVEMPLLLLYGAINGLITTAVVVVSLYVIGGVFNLPTALRLIELGQPNQPLLQRLLREAPGTYQHSIQVASLGEQAANAIGANSALVYVAALYHDVGKTINPAFFTENQQDVGNPHDVLNDPYRSAAIIISHVTEGEALARSYRLPNRVRDFIREHHGTTRVYVFYQQAVIRAGDDNDAVDAADFTYPGPRPQSRETALLMLADSCEATIRSMQPETPQEIEEAIDRIIEGKRRDGQLDQSGLTLNELSVIKRIFTELLKAMFHPRINYTEVISKARQQFGEKAPTPEPPPKAPAPLPADMDDESPLPDVPPLPRPNGKARLTGELPSVPLSPEESIFNEPES
ncbi:MAG: HDIG domain-containing protein [Anaerolineae bacterium]|jgi:hypothetical protein|nr:HDIG domain-containing protein [Anaerolineae bacterium]